VYDGRIPLLAKTVRYISDHLNRCLPHYFYGDSIEKKPITIAETVTLMHPHIVKALKLLKNKNMAIQFIAYTNGFKKDIYPFEGVIVSCM